MIVDKSWTVVIDQKTFVFYLVFASVADSMIDSVVAMAVVVDRIGLKMIHSENYNFDYENLM